MISTMTSSLSRRLLCRLPSYARCMSHDHVGMAQLPPVDETIQKVAATFRNHFVSKLSKVPMSFRMYMLYAYMKSRRYEAAGVPIPSFLDCPNFAVGPRRVRNSFHREPFIFHCNVYLSVSYVQKAPF